MKMLTANWMVLVVSAILYLASVVLFLKVPAMPHAETGMIKNAFPPLPFVPSWEFSNPEAEQLISELKTEKKTLSTKEQQIMELTQRLQTERAELIQATQMVAQLQAEFDKNALKVKDDETVNLKKLAKTYGVMAPESAATILEQLEDSAMVKIMLFMKNDENGAILEALSKKGAPFAKRAAEISERLRIASVKKAPTTTP